MDKGKLKLALEAYKKSFTKRWPDERYKWEAIQCFQTNWDINAENFFDMFTAATEKTDNLLASVNNFPRGQMQVYSQQEPETVRAMFEGLFDESKPVTDRIVKFQSDAEDICERLSPGKQHYQRAMAITVYLWLHNPAEYDIYKYTVFRKAAMYLDNEFVPKKGYLVQNIEGSTKFIDDIREAINEDKELVYLFETSLDNKCYPDKSHRTLAFDVVFYIANWLFEDPNAEPPISPEQTDTNIPEESISNDWEPYSRDDFLKEVYMEPSKYDSICGLLKKKKNIILQGAPGVGKTFAAERLAYSMMGKKDSSRIEMIQFHQNYSYEDFIIGYKPDGEGFELKPGVFYNTCKAAKTDPEHDYYFIIDEINRGNMSKIFGELLMLIEADYRGKEITLAYTGGLFCVPQNLYIIGMMNTADRSLAMIDYALRRRFSFITMEPGFTSKGFVDYQKSLNSETFDQLIEKIRELNVEISKDPTLKSGFCIGHSYFCGQKEATDEWMDSVVEYDILPMLEEYWFDDEKNVQKWQTILRGVFSDS